GRPAKDRQVHHGDRQAVGQRQRLRSPAARWVVERTFAWLGRCRRLAKDFERSIESARAWVFIANIRLLTRRLART
ncbi:transposase, partial [Mesorhizobium sp. M1406]|uniref:transposase n=1 Tax=Mesorhizobium sp. M1406 TaxID=2957099 RepID=UPI00333B1F3D